MRLPDWLDTAAWCVVCLLVMILAMRLAAPRPGMHTATPRPDRATGPTGATLPHQIIER